jgi:hypothetical protein
MTDETTPERPHVRAGSIAWGLIVIATAAAVLWVVAEPARRSAVTDWAATLTPGGAALVAVLVCGAILLLSGVLAAIRRAQRRS